ncbi:MAG: SPOR domain-containing protein [Cyclobacteriaceae bacterium]
MNEDYGLPEVEMKPIDRAKPVVPAAAAAAATTAKKRRDKEPTNYWPIIILALVFSLIAGGALYYFFLRSPAGTEITDSTPPDPLPLDDELPVPEEESSDKDNDSDTNESAAVNLDQPGTITSITERTGRYYIFLGSYKFRAYAQRHADQLAKDGFAVKLIEQDDWVGMRVAVGNYGSQAEAQPDAASITAKYGTKIAISQY